MSIIDKIDSYLDEASPPRGKPVDYNPKSHRWHSAADSKNWTPEQHRERAAKHMRSAKSLRKNPKYGESVAKQEEAQARKHERMALSKEGKGKKRAPNRQKGPGRSYSIYD